MSDPPVTHAGPASRRRLALHWKILLGLLLGGAVGLCANVAASRLSVPGVQDPLDVDANGIHDRLDWWVTHVTDPAGKVFLRVIFMVVIPLVFSALALAVIEMGNLRRLGRLGLRTLALTAVLSTMAVILGISLANLIRPGHAMGVDQRVMLRQQYARATERLLADAERARPLQDILLDIIPENPLQEMVGALDGSSKGNGMLSVMFFALVVGIAMAYRPDRCQTLIGVLDGVQSVSMTVVGFAMRLAPYGVALLVFGLTARLGLGVIRPLGGFAITALAGLALQMFLVYSLVLWWFAGMSPLTFFRRASSAIFMAFGSSSSNATLPTSLRVAEEELGLPRDVSRFVLTIGATGNQNGTALYEGVVVLFLAQLFLPHDPTVGQQVTVVVMAVLAGIGTAGVPGGSLPLIVVVLQTLGIPGETIAIILGIDRLLDMCRTAVNVTGDLVIAACVARSGPPSS